MVTYPNQTKTKSRVSNGKIITIMTLLYVYTLVLFVSVKAENSTSWLGTNSNDWEQPKNWTKGVPDANTDVIINEVFGSYPHYPEINGNAFCKNLFINGGASLNMGNETTLNITGDWILKGNFISRKETIIFSGSTVIASDFVSLNNVEITGTLVAPEGQMEILGEWKNDGKFYHNEGTVNFIGNSRIAGNSETEFYHVMINGTFTGGNETIRIAGNWSNWGNFNSTYSTVVFTGWENQFVNGNTSFYNLHVANVGKGVILKGNQHVENELKMLTGFENMYANNFNIRNTKTIPESNPLVAKAIELEKKNMESAKSNENIESEKVVKNQN